MKALILIGVALLSLFSILVLIFVCIGLPIWALVDCLGSKERTTKAKVAWGSVIAVFWSLGAPLYGIFESKDVRLKRVSKAAAVLYILSVVAGGFAAMYVAQRAATQFLRRSAELDAVALKGLGENDRLNVKNCLETMQQEAGGPWRRDRKLKTILWKLDESLKIYIQDGELASEEYEDWMAKFNSRKILAGDGSHGR